MVDVYYNNVWPTFPFLPTRPTLESLLLSAPVQSDAFSTVLLALCAYCGRLSPSSEDGLVGCEAGNVAADLWYEQARSGVYMCIRKGSSVEVAQALLLLALSDHGKGNETQAWILVGNGFPLNFHEFKVDPSKLRYGRARRTRYGLKWGLADNVRKKKEFPNGRDTVAEKHMERVSYAGFVLVASTWPTTCFV